jgi:hypothetical protein
MSGEGAVLAIGAVLASASVAVVLSAALRWLGDGDEVTVRRERVQDARNTGHWVKQGAEGAQDVITVRWDMGMRAYFVTTPGMYVESQWPDIEVLKRYLRWLESDAEGWTAARDNATTAIRMRLDLPGVWGEWKQGANEQRVIK